MDPQTPINEEPNLTIEEFIEIRRQSGERYGRPVVGVVFRSDLERTILDEFENIGRGRNDNPAVELCFPAFPVFFDHAQEFPCFVFYDEALLRAYLDRRRDPGGFAKGLLAALERSAPFYGLPA